MSAYCKECGNLVFPRADDFSHFVVGLWDSLVGKYTTIKRFESAGVAGVYYLKQNKKYLNTRIKVDMWKDSRELMAEVVA